jgi:hypothetical protein
VNWFPLDQNNTTPLSWGASGGAGSGGGGGGIQGGGGGSGGGVIMLSSPTITGTGLVRARGGNGGNGATNGAGVDGGGGGGGQGGVIALVTDLGTSPIATNVSGGTGGAAGGAGATAGVAGSAGVVRQYPAGTTIPGPTGPTGPGGLLATAVADLGVLTTVGPVGFPGVLLLSVVVPITTLGNSLLVHFSASGDNPGGGGGLSTFFRLFVDGALTVPPKRSTFTHGGGPGADAAPQSTAIVAKISGLAVGAHTISIFWASEAGGLATIDPTAAPAGPDHHATLLVEEVSV